MVLLMILLNTLYFEILFLFISYLDLKYRKIPNSFFIFTFCLSFILILLESLLFFNNFLIIILGKLFFFFLTFLPSLLLFSLKIIGGSDGKLIILIFVTHPVKYLDLNFVASFFLFFSLFFILLFIINYFLNELIKNNSSFINLFNSNSRYSSYQKFYIKTFYKFLDYSILSMSRGEKFICKSLLLIYNNEKKKIQILVQIRPPLIILIILTYLFVCLIKLII